MEFFEIFPWDNKFETGIELIDEQHKQLVNILNRLAAHLANRSKSNTLNEIFAELTAYADIHFKTEEKIWGKYLKSDEWFISHVETHQSFVEEISSLRSSSSEEELDDTIQAIVSFLSKWLVYHILDTDKRMALTVLSIESGTSVEQAKIDTGTTMNGSMRMLINTVITMYDTLSLRTMELMREKALRRQAEDALSRSEECWGFVLEGAADGVWDWNIQQDEVFRSEDDAIALEISDNKICHLKEASKVHPADRKRVRQQIQSHLDGATEFYECRYRVLRGDSTWSWILSRGKVVSSDERGNALRMVGTNSDITERELATLIYQHSDQAMFVTDLAHNIISVNPAFSTITGYSEQESVGQPLSYFGPELLDSDIYQEMWEELNSKGCWSSEIWGQRKNGESFLKAINIHSIITPQGDADYFIGLCSDITEKSRSDQLILDKTRQLEETNTALRVILSQPNNAQEELQSTILNQLEKSIFPYLDLLTQGLTDKQNREYLTLITEQLHSIGSSFIQRLSDPGIGLTKKEILVADLVKQGKNSKQIAQLLKLETRSVEAYRNKIRKKLNINNQKVSLSDYLSSQFGES